MRTTPAGVKEKDGRHGERSKPVKFGSIRQSMIEAVRGLHPSLGAAHSGKCKALAVERPENLRETAACYGYRAGIISEGLAMKPTDLIDQDSLRDDIPSFRPGDTLKVHVRVVEGTRERVQVFQGVVIRRQGSGVQESFTVRKISFGIGVERTFPVHAPTIAKIEVESRGDVRRAKLYYLRDLRGKAAKIKELRVNAPE